VYVACNVVSKVDFSKSQSVTYTVKVVFTSQTVQNGDVIKGKGKGSLSV